MAVELTDQLRDGTTKAHTMAENTGFASVFSKRVVVKSIYRRLVIDPWNVYSAMVKDILVLRGGPVVGPINFTALNRRDYLGGEDYLECNWNMLSKPISSTKKYLKETHNLTGGITSLMVFHPYTRYIEDLSVGQFLKTTAQRAMTLGERHGLHFYVFDAIPDAKISNVNCRPILDSLPIDQFMAERIVKEPKNAFHFNMLMFKELEGNLNATIGKVLCSVLPLGQREGITQTAAA